MKDLSGGQKARVALAELCLNAPDVVILVSNVRAKGKELYHHVLIPACRRKLQHEDVYQYWHVYYCQPQHILLASLVDITVY